MSDFSKCNLLEQINCLISMEWPIIVYINFPMFSEWLILISGSVLCVTEFAKTVTNHTKSEIQFIAEY